MIKPIIGFKMRGMDSSLLERVIAHLQNHKGSWPAIALDSGVPLRTLEKIARRETKNPGIAHIESLLKHLENKHLEVPL